MMQRLHLILLTGFMALSAMAQTPIAGALQSYNEEKRGTQRTQQYFPEAGAFVCENGVNRFTRALYGGWTDYRIETSDRPVFAIVKKNHHRHLRFLVNGVPLDSTDYCKASFSNGMRRYLLKDQRWDVAAALEVQVVACHHREGAVWLFQGRAFKEPVCFEARLCEIANPKLHRNGDIGADKPGVFEAAPGERGLQRFTWKAAATSNSYFVIDSINRMVNMPASEACQLMEETKHYNDDLAQRISFHTPDPYINTLASALAFAADGDWDGQTWLHGCIGWRMPLAGWRAAYVGDVLGWNERQTSHFDAYAKSQVNEVPATIPHPTQDAKQNMARAEKRWGTQMYSNGYICRYPEKNNQMHHYDMNLNFIDELLWHFQYNADTAYMRKLWPVITSHLAWEKRNYDADNDHLYDAYCCIWASDALYYSGGAVTHSSAYNYRGNLLAARIAELIGADAQPYHAEAEAILKAMNERLWIKDKGVWAEYQDGMGMKRLHESPAVWSVYTPVDCGACSPEQAWQATGWVARNIPRIPIASASPANQPSALPNGEGSYYTISTSNWMPYSWSINNVAIAEVMHTALAFFEAGRSDEGYRLLMGNIMDNMYYGQSPANFGQLSHHDAARGECYRDFGDCIGIASRTLVQGLFGVVPQALFGKCFVQPGFPEHWDSVCLKTPYLEYQYTRTNGKIRYEITQHFAQPLTIIVRQHLGNGTFRYTEGTNERHQVIEVEEEKQRNTYCVDNAGRDSQTVHQTDGCGLTCDSYGLSAPDLSKPFVKQDISDFFNASVSDIFKNEYLAPRPLTTTLQIPVQGIGEWCHPQYTPVINDSVFRSLITGGEFRVAGVPFSTPAEGANIIFTTLWNNYPDAVTIPLKGKASSAYLLMAGTTNHMQSRIDNALVVATYRDGTADTLKLRNPDNWCPIEQDYFVDGIAFSTSMPRPYRVCLGTGTVSRDLGEALKIKGVYGREIPGGAAQMLRMPLNAEKKLKSITVRPLSNDVVVGLMAITLQH